MKTEAYGKPTHFVILQRTNAVCTVASSKMRPYVQITHIWPHLEL